MVEEQPASPAEESLGDGEFTEPVDVGRRFQFSLLALFALTTTAAVYFFLERISDGHFAAGTLLTVGVAIPLALVVLWIARSFIEGSEPWATILFILGIGGAILACLLLAFGL